MPDDSGSRLDSAPSDWVRRGASLIAPGRRVLDVACGAGRHSRFLRDLGLVVTAVDRDGAVLEALGNEPGITTLQADLELAPWPFSNESFDAIVGTNYLHRPLFMNFPGTLRAGGSLIYETFAFGNERFGRPCNPRFLLRSNELLSLAEPLQVLAFEQGIVHHPKTAVMQRILAIKTPDAGVLDTAIPVPRLGPLR